MYIVIIYIFRHSKHPPPFGQIAGVSNLQLFPYEVLQGTYLQSYTYLHPFAFTLLTLSHSSLLYNLSVPWPVGYERSTCT